MAKYFVLLLLAGMVLPFQTVALTLDDALSFATRRLPAYRASKEQVRSSEALYKASLSPYLPRLDVTGSREHHNRQDDEFDVNRYDATISYIVFDGGRRKADRNIARLNLNSDREALRQRLLNLQFDVKAAFYTVLARKEIYQQRQLQYRDALKDFEIAEGRNRLGVVKRSDVLQASVRLEQARFDVRQAEGDMKKALADLNSLVGRFLGTPYDLEGVLPVDDLAVPGKQQLAAAALQRPIVQQARDSAQIADNNKALTESDFYPTFSLDLSYRKTDLENALIDTDTEDKSIGLFASWNLFELSKFYDREADLYQLDVSQEQTREVERNVLLELEKAFEDFMTDYESLALAARQLKTAEFNYEQALGEYKVGKGDVLSLVQSESLLADARLQLSTSRLNLSVSKAALEQSAGIVSLASLQRVGVPGETEN